MKVILYHDYNNVWPLPSAFILKVRHWWIYVTNILCHLPITSWQEVIGCMRDRKPLKAEQDHFRVALAKIKWMQQGISSVSRRPETAYIQYIPRNMHTVFSLLCFVVVIHSLIFPYPTGLLPWHCGNLTIAPVPAKQPWWIWINTSCEFIMNDCITTTKQSTTKPCAYFLGYTVCRPLQWFATLTLAIQHCQTVIKRLLQLSFIMLEWRHMCIILSQIPGSSTVC